MKLKVVETSLNLRIERGRSRMDYILSREVAEKQLEIKADVYACVEFMECNDRDYLAAFHEAGYNTYSAVDEKRHRGVLYAVRSEFAVEEIAMMQEPHMFHIRVRKDMKYFDLITMRILISSSDDKDFRERKDQWDMVMEYIDTLEDKENLILTGDWNHGVISEQYSEARRFFNYQMIERALRDKNIELYNMEGTSYRGYMKIDHIASGAKIEILNASYLDAFPGQYRIGVPDHSFIVAELKCA